ncbi:TerD family protein [Streptomyces sp. NPDC046324]|uniref:TerD family protein n=1 Tax=Streptomyces sp. NPDC046324 TaxID=3154915 RepID=UPI0033F7CFB9
MFAENPTHPDASIEHIAGPVAENIAGGGDKESFVAPLSRLPPHADRVVFAVSSFDGSTFRTVQSAHWAISRRGAEPDGRCERAVGAGAGRERLPAPAGVIGRTSPASWRR